MNIDESRLEGMSDEVKERMRSATSTEELLTIAADAGVELTDDDLEGISGGWDLICSERKCPEFRLGCMVAMHNS